MRSTTLATALCGLLAACGSSNEASSAGASGDADAPAATEQASAERTAAGSQCDALADKMLESAREHASTAGDNEFMTAAQQIEFATTMVEGIRTGCKADDRLAEFPEQMECLMGAENREAWSACDALPKAAEFDTYMKSLLASAMQLDALPSP